MNGEALLRMPVQIASRREDAVRSCNNHGNYSVLQAGHPSQGPDNQYWGH
jgi:hypothetical protein